MIYHAWMFKPDLIFCIKLKKQNILQKNYNPLKWCSLIDQNEIHFMSTSTCTHVKLCMTCSAKVKLLLVIYFCRVLNNKRKAEMSNLLDTTSTRTTGPTLAPAVSTTESDQIMADCLQIIIFKPAPDFGYEFLWPA